MGNNYYARIIPTKKRKLELCNLINTNDFHNITFEIDKTFGSFNKYELTGGEIHLGKRSGGWKFLWNPNWYEVRNGHCETEEIEPGHTSTRWIKDPSTIYKIYDLTKESIKAFIDRSDVEIYNEYDEKQDKEEFWNMALNWTTWTNEDGSIKEAWDGDTYEEWERQNNPNYRCWPFDSETIKFWENVAKIKLNKYKTDFYSDGLRFSVSTEFS